MRILKLLENLLIKNAIIVAILSGLLIGVGLYLILKPAVLPMDLDKMSMNEVKEGKFVALKTFILIQGYATETGTDSEYSYYLIAGIDKNDLTYLMSIRVNAEEGDRIVNLANVSTDYFWFTDQFYYGILHKIQGARKVYFDEVLTELNAVDPVSYYYLEATEGVYAPADSTKAWFGWFIGFLGVVMLILTIITKIRYPIRTDS